MILKNKSHFFVKIALVAASLMILPTVVHADDDCQSACKLYTDCAEVITNRSATAKEKETLTGGCMKTCSAKKHQKGILMCYKESKSKPKTEACNVYSQCITKNSKK
jgi:Cys-rich protein (TIGR04453 family)